MNDPHYGVDRDYEASIDEAEAEASYLEVRMPEIIADYWRDWRNNRSVRIYWRYYETVRSAEYSAAEMLLEAYEENESITLMIDNSAKIEALQEIKNGEIV